jgi:hypothetical protein
VAPHVFLACLRGEAALPLGIAMRDRHDGPILYYYGNPDQPYHSRSNVESAALWHFIAEHGQHSIAPLYDFSREWNDLNRALDEPYIVGGDSDVDISLEDYVADWPEGQPDHKSQGTGYLTCAQDRERLWLGPAYGESPDRILFFHAGGPGDPPNSGNPPLNRALWRFLTRHPMHVLAVSLDEEAGYTTIGREDLDEFVAGWTG